MGQHRPAVPSIVLRLANKKTFLGFKAGGGKHKAQRFARPRRVNTQNVGYAHRVCCHVATHSAMHAADHTATRTGRLSAMASVRTAVRIRWFHTPRVCPSAKGGVYARIYTYVYTSRIYTYIYVTP